MIRSFKHKGLEHFYRTGKKSGIVAQHADKLRRILAGLDVAAKADDLDLPGYFLHPLKGNRKGFWTIRVKTNWRVTFRFIDGDVEIVNYEDYH